MGTIYYDSKADDISKFILKIVNILDRDKSVQILYNTKYVFVNKQTQLQEYGDTGLSITFKLYPSIYKSSFSITNIEPDPNYKSIVNVNIEEFNEDTTLRLDISIQDVKRDKSCRISVLDNNLTMDKFKSILVRELLKMDIEYESDTQNTFIIALVPAIFNKKSDTYSGVYLNIAKSPDELVSLLKTKYNAKDNNVIQAVSMYLLYRGIPTFFVVNDKGEYSIQLPKGYRSVDYSQDIYNEMTNILLKYFTQKSEEIQPVKYMLNDAFAKTLSNYVCAIPEKITYNNDTHSITYKMICPDNYFMHDQFYNLEVIENYRASENRIVYSIKFQSKELFVQEIFLHISRSNTYDTTFKNMIIDHVRKTLKTESINMNNNPYPIIVDKITMALKFTALYALGPSSKTRQ